jgi:hypothetical protein
MKDKKQTAVEWLQIQLKKGIDFNPLDRLGYTNAVNNLFEQAKEMEKEQMIDFAYKCSISYRYEIERKYNETYGGDK